MGSKQDRRVEKPAMEPPRDRNRGRADDEGGWGPPPAWWLKEQERKKRKKEEHKRKGLELKCIEEMPQFPGARPGAPARGAGEGAAGGGSGAPGTAPMYGGRRGGATGTQLTCAWARSNVRGEPLLMVAFTTAGVARVEHSDDGKGRRFRASFVSTAMEHGRSCKWGRCPRGSSRSSRPSSGASDSSCELCDDMAGGDELWPRRERRLRTRIRELGRGLSSGSSPGSARKAR